MALGGKKKGPCSTIENGSLANGTCIEDGGKRRNAFLLSLSLSLSSSANVSTFVGSINVICRRCEAIRGERERERKGERKE